MSMAMVRTAALLRGLAFRVVSNRRSTAAGAAAIIVAIATDLGYTLDPELVLEIILYGYGLCQLFMRDSVAKKRAPGC
jgi:predicted double-glycine peptidase